MKTIGIIAAMEEEISCVKSIMDVKVAKSVANMEYYVGKLSSKSVVAVKSGIGKVNASVCCQILIDQFAVDYVINIGTAGAVFSGLDVGDIVVSSDACYHDFDCSAFGYKHSVIPRMEESFFKADEELINTAMKCAESLTEKHQVYKGRIASGDQFISTLEAKNKIWNNCRAYCAEMEGAAIAQTCFLNNMPFLIVREVSDKADESAVVSFDVFVQSYIKNYQELIQKIVESA